MSEGLVLRTSMDVRVEGRGYLRKRRASAAWGGYGAYTGSSAGAFS